jgi:NitT/TauT family transport system substrate-binding protein
MEKKMMIKKITILCLILGILGAGYFYKQSFSVQPNQTLQMVNIAQFGKAKFLLYLPLYIADEAGFLAQQGLKANYIFAGNDDQVFATVMSGDADFGVGDPVFTAIAAEKGLKAKTVALLINNLGLTGYTNKPDVPNIKKPEDLADLRVGSFPKPSTTYTLLNQLKNQHPKALKNMTIIEGAFGTQLAMLNANKVDIAIDLEPTVSQVEAKGYRVVLALTPFVERQAITGLMVTQTMINQNPETVQKMVTALQQAVKAMYKDRQLAYAVAQKLFPDLSKQVIKNAVDRMLQDTLYPKSIAVNDAYWQATLKTRQSNGDLKKSQATSLAVDNSFANKAH